MRVAAVILGLILFGGLVVLAVAGVSGATAVLVTGAAVVAMIGLGNAVGGRHTPNTAPYRPGDDTDDDPEIDDDHTGTGSAHGATCERSATDAADVADAVEVADAGEVGAEARDAER